MALNFLATRFTCSWPWNILVMLCDGRIVCGCADPLIAQARALRDALTRTGVVHEFVEDAGMPHGYVQMEFLPAARPALERMLKFLDARVR